MLNTIRVSKPEAYDEHWMRHALTLAHKAAVKGEVPVGAVIVYNNRVLGEGFNQPISSHNPTAHAEIVALQNAAFTQKNYRLPGSRLYVTLEPCTMCVGAMIHARVDTVVYAAGEPRAGALVSQLQLANQPFYNHCLHVVHGPFREESSELLKQFFKLRRQS